MNGLFGGGTGTENDPYLVEDKYDLMNISNGLNFSYDQTRNIEFLETDEWTPLGSEETPYTGFYNGKEFSITNLNINNSSLDSVGLFGVMYNGWVVDLHLKNVKVSGRNNVGAIVGSLMVGGVSRCNVEGEIEGNVYVGGLTGFSAQGQIDVCSFNGSVTGNEIVGGLVGFFQDGSMYNAYSKGVMRAISKTGGIVGVSESETYIEKVYSTMDIESESIYGGLIGEQKEGSTLHASYSINEYLWNTLEEYNEINYGYLVGVANGEITNSYYAETIETNRNDFPVSTSIGMDELLIKSTYTDNEWDFDLWMMENGSLPYLFLGDVEDLSTTIQCNVINILMVQEGGNPS